MKKEFQPVILVFKRRVIHKRVQKAEFGIGQKSFLLWNPRMTSASLHKEPLLVEAGGAGLERGSRHAVIGMVHRVDALLAESVVQSSVLKTRSA